MTFLYCLSLKLFDYAQDGIRTRDLQISQEAKRLVYHPMSLAP
jgi:hypothetical protein